MQPKEKRSNIKFLDTINKHIRLLKDSLEALNNNTFPKTRKYIESEIEQLKLERYEYLDQETKGHVIRRRKSYITRNCTPPNLKLQILVAIMNT